jgi:hypothetical protein
LFKEINDIHKSLPNNVLGKRKKRSFQDFLEKHDAKRNQKACFLSKELAFHFRGSNVPYWTHRATGIPKNVVVGYDAFHAFPCVSSLNGSPPNFAPHSFSYGYCYIFSFHNHPKIRGNHGKEKSSEEKGRSGQEGSAEGRQEKSPAHAGG